MDLIKLYKYLDAQGGLAMLRNSNIQFTNATKLNDPFDCHPSLIDFSQVPTERARTWGKEAIMDLESNRFERNRDNTWLCSLSKNYNSLLMWSYYNCHKGICIGIDMENVRKYLSKIICSMYIGAIELEVQYMNIIKKPDYFGDYQDFFRYQLSTKSKDWEHEQEVRLVLMDPTPSQHPNHPCFVQIALPYKTKDKNKVIDWKEVRAYLKIGGECFDSIYLGVNIDDDVRKQIINIAKGLNPEIKIYQMKVDANAFKLQPKLLI